MRGLDIEVELESVPESWDDKFDRIETELDKHARELKRLAHAIKNILKVLERL